MSPVTTHVEHRFVKVILISVSLLAMMHSRYQVQGAVEPMSVSFSWLVIIRYPGCAQVCCGLPILQSFDLVIRPCESQAV